MKQPDSVDIGTRMDVAKHRLDVAQEDLDTAHLTFDAGQFRGANNRAYYSIFHTISAVLAYQYRNISKGTRAENSEGRRNSTRQ